MKLSEPRYKMHLLTRFTANPLCFHLFIEKKKKYKKSLYFLRYKIYELSQRPITLFS